MAEQENRFEEAAKVYVELIEYGSASGIESVYIDKLVSRAWEMMGMGGMTNVISKLGNADFCRETI